MMKSISSVIWCSRNQLGKKYGNDMKSENMKSSYIFSALLFLLSMNFANRFHLITVFLLMLILAGAANKKILLISKNGLLLGFFSCCYIVFMPKEQLFSVTTFAVHCLYVVGWVIGSASISRTEEEKQITNYIFAIALGSFSHGFLNFLINIFNYGFYVKNRALPDIWTGDIWVATAQSTVFVVFVGMLFYFLFIIKKRLYLKLGAICGTVVIILYNLILANRTIFVLLTIVFGLSFVSDIVIFKRKNILKFFMPLVFFLGILMVGYFTNICGIKSFVEGLPLFSRLENISQSSVYEDARVKLYTYYIHNMSKYPFGGLNMRHLQSNYGHNIFLDVYDMSGIFPFIILVLFFVSAIYSLIRLIRNRNVGPNIKILLIGVFLALFLQFMIEPILDGVPWLFLLFCIIVGMLDKYLYNLRYKNRSKEVLL